jgi:hypothetical protein
MFVPIESRPKAYIRHRRVTKGVLMKKYDLIAIVIFFFRLKI